MTDNSTIAYYSEHALRLSEQYDAVAPEQVHADWLKHLPEEGVVLDVGAGSGRDARFLASHKLSVVAVEPARALRELAQRKSENHAIRWIDDALPKLPKVAALQMKFDLILLSAVWMHLPKAERESAFRHLSGLLKPNGKLVVTLRFGPCDDERKMYAVSAEELQQLASQFGLVFHHLHSEHREDVLARQEVSWQTVMMTLPDDGTGAFPLIRNIVVNDSKSSTYKVGLLRSLLRIAEGHPGAVLERTNEHVVIPLGLVAFYWLKLYKPLIDQHGLQQNSDAKKGLGFIKPNGWQKLTDYSANDFHVGTTCSHLASGAAFVRTLKDIAMTIRDMPAKYIQLPNSEESVFDVVYRSTRKYPEQLTLDMAFFESFGQFCIPTHIWDTLTRFSVWIEPALINEWANLILGYKSTKARKISRMQVWNALMQTDDQRITQRVRDRVTSLQKSDKVVCCWSGSTLVKDAFDIDHAIPFSRWPNNDLWNLLPSKSRVNASKSDKLASTRKLKESRERILHWWQQGWLESQSEFFIQAQFALPNLSLGLNAPVSLSFEDVFDAFALQQLRLRDFQQLQEWE